MKRGRRGFCLHRIKHNVVFNWINFIFFMSLDCERRFIEVVFVSVYFYFQFSIRRSFPPVRKKLEEKWSGLWPQKCFSSFLTGFLFNSQDLTSNWCCSMGFSQLMSLDFLKTHFMKINWDFHWIFTTTSKLQFDFPMKNSSDIEKASLIKNTVHLPLLSHRKAIAKSWTQ